MLYFIFGTDSYVPLILLTSAIKKPVSSFPFLKDKEYLTQKLLLNMSASNMTKEAESSILFNDYDKEVLIENLRDDSTKTRNALFAVAIIFLISDLLALFIAHVLSADTIIYVVAVPILLVGLGFLARSKPMLGASLGALLFVLVMSYNVYALGAASLFSGLIMKAVIIYFLIKSFMHAKEAEKAKRSLALYQ